VYPFIEVHPSFEGLILQSMEKKAKLHSAEIVLRQEPHKQIRELAPDIILYFVTQRDAYTIALINAAGIALE